MNVSIMLLIYGALSLFSMFIELNKLIRSEYKKLAWINFFSAALVYIFLSLNLLSIQYKFINSIPKLIASILLFFGIGFIIYRFEQKYKKELKLNDKGKVK